MEREITLSKADIVHPQNLGGRSLWLAPEVEDLMRRLHEGDPTLGWEGDPRLALYRSKDGRWELQRLEHDGQYRLVCTSRPGLDLDNRLIMHLVAHDARRGFNAAEAVDKRNAAVERERSYKAGEKVAAAEDKLRWALNRDLKHLCP